MTNLRPTTRLCPACSAPGALSDGFCQFCGTLVGEGLECEQHPGRPAEAACVVCGMPLCRSCRGAKPALCPDSRHAAIANDWVRVFAANSEFEADCVVQNLKDRGIPSNAFSSRRFVSPTDATDAVRVFVKKDDLARAVSCVADITGPHEGQPDTTVEGI